MAHFKPILGELSGSIAANTFSHNRFGPYVRNRSIPTDPGSNGQTFSRQWFTEAAQRWKDLSASERSEWSAYAAGTPVTNPFGNTVYLTGLNWFVAYYSFQKQISIATPNTDAPSANGTLQWLAFGVSVSAASGIVVVEPTPNPTTGDGGFLLQWSNEFSPAGNFFKGPFPWANRAVLDDSLVYPYTVPGTTGLFTEGMRLGFRVRLLNEAADTGRLSIPQIFTATIVA